MRAVEAARLEGAHQRQAEALREKQTCLTAWEKQRLAELPASPLASEALTALDTLTKRLAEQQRLLEAEENAYEQARHQRDVAQQAVDQSRERYHQAQEAYRQAEHALQQVTNALKTCQARYETYEQQRCRYVQELAAVFSSTPDWQIQLEANVTAFREQARKDAEVWAINLQAHQRALAQKQDLEHQIEVQNSAFAGLQSWLDQAERQPLTLRLNSKTSKGSVRLCSAVSLPRPFAECWMTQWHKPNISTMTRVKGLLQPSAKKPKLLLTTELLVTAIKKKLLLLKRYGWNLLLPYPKRVCRKLIWHSFSLFLTSNIRGSAKSLRRLTKGLDKGRQCSRQGTKSERPMPNPHHQTSPEQRF